MSRTKSRASFSVLAKEQGDGIRGHGLSFGHRSSDKKGRLPTGRQRSNVAPAEQGAHVNAWHTPHFGERLADVHPLAGDNLGRVCRQVSNLPAVIDAHRIVHPVETPRPLPARSRSLWIAPIRNDDTVHLGP